MSDILDTVGIGLSLVNGSPNIEDFTKQLDAAIEKDTFDEIQKQARHKTKSKLKIRYANKDLASWFNRLYTIYEKNALPIHGDPTRDFKLCEFWKDEPILAGAVYSMAAKMTALSWTMIGKRSIAERFSNILSYAASMEGYDWGSFISASAQDFYTADRGVFWETPRDGNNLTGQLAELGHIDSLQCALTGNTKWPVLYISAVTDQVKRFKPGQVLHFSSMPSAREDHLGIGFCAVSRAYRAAKLLLGLHNYDEEKLANLPPEGVAGVTGLTMEEFTDALALWQAQRESNNSLTFPQVLWLIGSNPQAKVNIDFHGFSQIPESFDRGTVVEQYVNTLALDFGVDAREFWPVSTSSLGTAAESEIQHMKAKGKGPGEFISIVERRLNMELPEGVSFSFDTQDIDEDEKAAAIANAWVSALLPLTGAGQPPQQQPRITDQGKDGETPPPPQAPQGGGQEMISKDVFLRLLIDRGVLPNWVLNDDKAVITDIGVVEKTMYRYQDQTFDPDEDIAVFKWANGKLSQERLEAYTVRSQNAPTTVQELPVAEIYSNMLETLRERSATILEGHRNIRGKPIPEREALRGAGITKRAVEAEIERWRKHPVLSQYVPTAEEEQEVANIVEALA